MAQRPRKKGEYQELGQDEDEASLVKLGTPLPPLTSTKPDQNVFVPLWKQEVTDEQGRRRLHGAFTGGFSAGYFNTVGSKEGWNPATFKISRTDRKPQEKSIRSQRPEDFMDEEDLAELAQSKSLQTNSNFKSTSTTDSHFLTKGFYDPLTGTTLGNHEPPPPPGLSRATAVELAFSELVQPSNIRAGYKIMQKMGWREGQGIGPRVTHQRRMLLASKLGLSLESEIEQEEEAAEYKKHLFAPIDRPVKPVHPWNGSSGLGALPHSQHRLSGAFPQLTGSTVETRDHHLGLKIPQGTSFGLGALNDTEDDDQDIYGAASDQVTSDPRARSLLNLSEATSTDRKQYTTIPHSLPKASIPLVHHGGSVFQDNTKLPKGFCLSVSSSSGPPPTSYAPPQVPDRWEPRPNKIWEAAQPTTQPPALRPSPRHPSRTTNADDRARLIGEQAPPRSIFDFISAKDKARLEDAKQLAQASSSSRTKTSNQAGTEHHPHAPAPENSVVIPKLDPVVAKSALRGFVPFSHDLPKQERYQLYLQSQAGILPSGTRFAPKITKEMTAEVINKELDGFAKSALMFKPMSAMMASRFTTAASSSAGGELAAPEPGLRQPVFTDQQPEESEPVPESKTEESTEPVSQADQAVRVDMFGMLTRSTKKFYPQKLLCKRLNVPNPFPDGPPAETTTTKSSSNNHLTEFLASRGFQPAASTSAGTGGHTDQDGLEQANPSWLRKGDEEDTTTAQPIHQVGLGGDETQGREILTTSRPPLDLFKAIFGNDTEGEISENEEVDVSNQDELVIPHPPATSVRDTADPKVPSDGTTKPIPPPPHLLSLTTPVVVDPQVVENLSSFKPTFSSKKNQVKDLLQVADHQTGTKKKNNKKKRVLISFDDDEQADDGPLDSSSMQSKKKKNKKKEQDKQVVQDRQTHAPSQSLHEQFSTRRTKPDAKGEDDEEEWVEAVAPIPIPIPPHPHPHLCEPNQNPTHRTTKPVVRLHRMTAADLMD